MVQPICPGLRKILITVGKEPNFRNGKLLCYIRAISEISELHNGPKNVDFIQIFMSGQIKEPQITEILNRCPDNRKLHIEKRVEQLLYGLSDEEILESLTFNQTVDILQSLN